MDLLFRLVVMESYNDPPHLLQYLRSYHGPNFHMNPTPGSKGLKKVETRVNTEIPYNFLFLVPVLFCPCFIETGNKSTLSNLKKVSTKGFLVSF